jgi:hypothetical protein
MAMVAEQQCFDEDLLESFTGGLRFSGDHFSLARAALSTRGAQNQILINSITPRLRKARAAIPIPRWIAGRRSTRRMKP